MQAADLATLRTDNQRLQENNNRLLLVQQKFDDLQNQLRNNNNLVQQISDLRIQLQTRTEQLSQLQNNQQ